MKWSIKKEFDGVITDDPKQFLEVCDEWEQGMREIEVSWGQRMGIAWINFMVIIFGAMFWWKHGRTGEGKKTPERAVSSPSKEEKGAQ